MLTNILEIVVPILVPVILAFLAPYARAWLRTNTANLAERAKNATLAEAIWRVEKIIEACVIATNQTYVEALKRDGAFTKEAQMEAFTQTLNKIMGIVTAELKLLIIDSVGDFDLFIQTKLEEAVNKAKG